MLCHTHWCSGLHAKLRMDECHPISETQLSKFSKTDILFRATGKQTHLSGNLTSRLWELGLSIHSCSKFFLRKICLDKQSVVNRGERLGSPAGKHQTSKQRCHDYTLDGPRPCTIFCIAFMHCACMNYVIKTFVSVSSWVRGKQPLCFQGQKREKKYNKELCRISYLWTR